MSAIHQQENSLHSFAKLSGLPSQLGQPGKVGCMGSSVQGAADMQSPGVALWGWQLQGPVQGESQGGILSWLSIFALV